MSAEETAFNAIRRLADAGARDTLIAIREITDQYIEDLAPKIEVSAKLVEEFHRVINGIGATTSGNAPVDPDVIAELNAIIDNEPKES